MLLTEHLCYTNQVEIAMHGFSVKIFHAPVNCLPPPCGSLDNCEQLTGALL
jgi:hypothetical protein